MWKDFLSLVYPECCAGCGRSLVRNEYLVCTFCIHSLPKIASDHEQEMLVARKFYGKVQVEECFALLRYQRKGTVQKLVYGLKYRNMPNLGLLLGQMLGQALQRYKAGTHADYLLPVPLHPQKLGVRGYNQAEKICEGLAEVLQKPVLPGALQRKAATTTQTRRSRYARWQNVETVFEVAPEYKSRLQHRHILLVDDVVTTGATTEACVQQLLQLPGTRVSVAAVASA